MKDESAANRSAKTSDDGLVQFIAGLNDAIHYPMQAAAGQ
jgi:hypothetical protein